MPEVNTIKMGVLTVPIVPQSHARLRRQIPKILSKEEIDELTAVAEPDIDGETGEKIEVSSEEAMAKAMKIISAKTYDLLCVLAPQLKLGLPRYAFEGYGSQEEMDNDIENDEAIDAAPTLPQIVDAFDKALETNGLKRLAELIGLKDDIGQLFSAAGDAANPPTSGRPQTPTLPA